MIRIGIIGCGAASQQLHLPAIQRVGGYKISAIVDTQEDAARAVAKRLGVAFVGIDYRQVQDVDAVLISTPHSLHADMVRHFLERGVHVLCEKPLALTVRDAEQLIALADQKSLTLAVGVFRRYYPVSGFMRQVVVSGWLGKLLSVDVEEGGAYDWDLQSKAMMVKSLAGGGVLVDTGAHTIDRVLWVMGGEVELLSYEDNSQGGLETDCVVATVVKHDAAEVPLRVVLSRTRLLKNRFLFSFEHGRLEIPANDPSRAWFVDERLSKTPDCDGFRIETRPLDLDADLGPAPYFEAQLASFAESIKSGAVPLNDGRSTLPCVKLTEECYAKRSAMPEPWATADFVKRIEENAYE